MGSLAYFSQLTYPHLFTILIFMQVAHIKAIFFPNGENTLAPPKIGHVRLKDSRGKTQGIYDLKIRHTNEII